MYSFLNKLKQAVLASLFFTPYTNAYPGTPTALSGMNATALRKIAWDKKLREESVRPCIWSQVKSAIKIVNDEINIIKSGVFLEVDSGLGSQGQSVTLAMSTPLQKAPQWGTEEAMLGNEDESDLLWVTLFYNEVKKAVKYKQWGYDFNDTSYLKFVESYGQKVIDFYAELYDTRIQQSVLLTYAEELTKAPVSKAQQFNKNWCIPNLDEADYPSWDKDALTIGDGTIDSDNYYSSRAYSGSTTFVENIAASLMAASGTSSTSKALMNVDFLEQMSYYLPHQLLMDPVMLDGIPSYFILVHPRVKHWVTNPNKTGALGEHMQAVTEYRDPKRQTIMGEIGRVFENLVFVLNYRAPTIEVSGAAGSYSIVPGFLWPGNNDDRNNAAWSATSGSQNYVFEINYAIGANAVAEYLRDPLKTKLPETTEYGQIKGEGAYLGQGLQIPAFDKDAAGQGDGSSTTQIQRGSCIIPTSRVPIVSIS